MSESLTRRGGYDVVIVGGGHNGLTAAAYLAGAGLSVTVLERLDHTGGAAVSAQAFPGFPARLSRYAYLVSLLPDSVISDLGLSLRLESRATASYTPVRRGGVSLGLLVERPEGPATRESFRALTGSDAEYAAWRDFYRQVGELAAVVAPTLTKPLPRASALQAQVEPELWRELVERPLGEAIERHFRDPAVRGVVATDALIGTFARLDDPSLAQNRCFLYHLIGNGTGEWRVPVGGMGAVTDALSAAASKAGAELVTSAEVTAIRPGQGSAEIEVRGSTGTRQTLRARFVLSCVAPWVLYGLLGEERDPAAKPVGAQLKVNFLLSRLPRLKSGADPRVAFAGTLHLGEDYPELDRAYDEAAAGQLPARLPGEVYCHSLTDPSILGQVPAGTQTLTYFGLHLPATLFADPATRAARKALAVERAIASLDEHLADPVESVVARDAAGPCIEAKIPQDIEVDLGMPGGHIFHGDLAWPWAAADAVLDTPAARWGAATRWDGILLGGSGAQRGGAVSGLGGHNAAQAILEVA